MLDGLLQILRGASALARELTVDDVRTKADLDFVTNVDLRIDRYLSAELAKLTPDIPVFTEERLTGGERLKGRFWIVDPIDGTHNLVAGAPFVAISAALVDCDGSSEAGGIADIYRDEIYLAQKGRGSRLGGGLLKLSAEPSTLLGVSTGAGDDLLEAPAGYRELRRMGKWRNFGAQALHLCYVARGRLGLAISKEARLWDDAAGRLIAAEAGACYMSFAEAQEGRANRLPADTPLKSLCAHPRIFDAAAACMETAWRE